ncbi:hypothetical protein N7509_000530 [Penicillium cosmopolitanum]|uniref:Uncharacterized protein n=1 Tax=Penicillium cosmopolitanum TaxID=1131564 RepID=A0A9W9WAS8_9EURO|nr:uncharacterized protein N7509_000530 [Penicillium cosmopolitanum]KAJ5413903.1 hypothetical protein N7509_000530 [Penicillium cosmopolitanum]
MSQPGEEPVAGPTEAGPSNEPTRPVTRGSRPQLVFYDKKDENKSNLVGSEVIESLLKMFSLLISSSDSLSGFLILLLEVLAGSFQVFQS